MLTPLRHVLFTVFLRGVRVVGGVDHTRIYTPLYFHNPLLGTRDELVGNPRLAGKALRHLLETQQLGPLRFCLQATGSEREDGGTAQE